MDFGLFTLGTILDKPATTFPASWLDIIIKKNVQNFDAFGGDFYFFPTLLLSLSGLSILLRQSSPC